MSRDEEIREFAGHAAEGLVDSGARTAVVIAFVEGGHHVHIEGADQARVLAALQLDRLDGTSRGRDASLMRDPTARLPGGDTPLLLPRAWACAFEEAGGQVPPARLVAAVLCDVLGIPCSTDDVRRWCTDIGLLLGDAEASVTNPAS